MDFSLKPLIKQPPHHLYSESGSDSIFKKGLSVKLFGRFSRSFTLRKVTRIGRFDKE